MSTYTITLLLVIGIGCLSFFIAYFYFSHIQKSTSKMNRILYAPHSQESELNSLYDIRKRAFTITKPIEKFMNFLTVEFTDYSLVGLGNDNNSDVKFDSVLENIDIDFSEVDFNE